jgi:hypothetical protein
MLTPPRYVLAQPRWAEGKTYRAMRYRMTDLIRVSEHIPRGCKHSYTQVRTASQNLGFTCAISFCLNIYYGTLYAYTPNNGTDDSHDPIEPNSNTVACAPVGGGEDLSSNEIQ